MLPVSLGLLLAFNSIRFWLYPSGAPAAKILLEALLFLVAGCGSLRCRCYFPLCILGRSRFSAWSLLGDFSSPAPFRPDALSISALAGEAWALSVPQWIIVAAVLAATVFALTKSPRTPSGFAGITFARFP